MTRTLAEIPVSAAVYDEIADVLQRAGYIPVIGGTIDMTGLAIVKAARSDPTQIEIDLVGDAGYYAEQMQ